MKRGEWGVTPGDMQLSLEEQCVFDPLVSTTFGAQAQKIGVCVFWVDYHFLAGRKVIIQGS